jgi:hypothetical protein
MSKCKAARRLPASASCELEQCEQRAKTPKTKGGGRRAPVLQCNMQCIALRTSVHKDHNHNHKEAVLALNSFLVVVAARSTACTTGHGPRTTAKMPGQQLARIAHTSPRGVLSGAADVCHTPKLQAPTTSASSPGQC